MSGRVLVVDDIIANVKVLEAKLQAKYYTVLTALSGPEAIRIAQEEKPDIILLDVMMPGMDGYTCCTRLKSIPELAHIPVVMVTALDQVSDRVRGLEAGADDFLTKPPNDVALFARVRSLVRMKTMIDELRMRDDTFSDFGMDDASGLDPASSPLSGEVVIVDPLASRAETAEAALKRRLSVNCHAAANADEAMALANSIQPELFIITCGASEYDGLRLCSQLNSNLGTRHSAIIAVVDDSDFDMIGQSLDVGANDYVMRPVDENELVARARTQLMRKVFADRLRDNMQDNMRMAVMDGLTGLHNRRYLDQHLQRQLIHCAQSQSELSVMLLDLDRFKSINDTYGHSAGDAVLVEFARRMREKMRGVDLVARYGGEEFAIVMPETPADAALNAAERLRAAIADKPFSVEEAPGGELSVTCSIGVSESSGRRETPRSIMSRADAALYQSKSDGRNRVTLSGPDDGPVAQVG